MTTKLYQPHSGYDFEASSPLPCPLCGKEPEVIFTGNERGHKKHTVKIRCGGHNGCNLELTVGGLKRSSQQITIWALENWNRRTA